MFADNIDTTGEKDFASAIRKAGLDWEPTIQGVFLADGSMVPGVNVVTSPTGAVLGVAGNRRQAQSYAAIAEAIDSPDAEGKRLSDYVDQKNVAIFDNGGRFAATGTIKGGGAEVRTAHGKMAVRSHTILAGSHNGKLSSRIMAANRCVVCDNTLRAAIGEDVWSYRAKSTAGMLARVKSFGAAVREQLSDFARSIERAQAMADKRITTGEAIALWESVLDATEAKMVAGKEGDIVIPGADLVGQILGETEIRQGGKRGKVLEYLLESYETAPGADPGSAWGAYQALTYYASHKAGRSEEGRSASLLFGPLAATVERAEQAAFRLATA